MKTIYSLLTAVLFFITSQSFAQANFSSNVAAGNWNAAGTWTLTSGTDADGIPDADDNVTILDGHSITITDNTAACASLTVGGGTSGILTIGDNSGDALAVSGNITVNVGGTMQAMNSAGVIGGLTISGNITNNGVFDLASLSTIGASTLFNGVANQTVSVGATATRTEFYMVTINNTGADNNNIIEFISNSTIFLQLAGFLTLTDGIFKISAPILSANEIFTSANYTIPAGTGLWLNRAGNNITGKAGTATLGGLLRITAGTYNVGTAADHSLEYTGSTAQLIVDGGTLNIRGRFCRDASAASIINYTHSAGNITVGTGGSTSTTRALFEIANAGSSFTHSGGTVILQRSNASFTSDYFNEAGTSNVTATTNLQIGNASTPASQVFRIYSTVPLSALSLFSTNSPTSQLLSNITVNNGVTMNNLTTFNTNNYNISIKGNWSKGTTATFNAGTGTVSFIGSAAQILGGLSATTFNNLVINNSSATGVTLSIPGTVTGTLTLTDGYVITTATNLLTFNDNATVTGASDASFVNGPVRKIGNDAFIFPTGNSAGGFYQPIAISAPANPTDDFTAEYIRSSAVAFDADMVAPIVNVSSCDYWTLNRNAGSSSVDVTLSWNANSPCNGKPYVLNPATLTVAHHNGTAWDEAGTSGSFTGNATAGTVTRNAVSVFSPFALGNTVVIDNPLPVKFGNLQGYVKNNDAVQLDWEIYTEDNVGHYEVQRSADGTHFNTIGSVPLRNPGQAGYSYLDAAPLAGLNYYRIVAVDKDSKLSYSLIIRVNLKEKATGIAVYPNPVKNGIVSFQSPVLAKDIYTVRLINSIAQEVYNTKLNHSGGLLSYSFQLPAGTTPGVYYLQLESNNKILQEKIVVQ